ncbi:DNA polymerase thumb domain-containing protein [Bordetella pertussis]|uniref:DinB/UmuC family translesion DNA polymerase n=1 Tax=Bordetella pertussis TaxID=520 RepID=UPI0039B6093E
MIKPSRVLDFLQPLPVRKVPGVGKVMQARLEQLGIQTVGDLSRHSVAELEQRFGRYGVRLYELARGIDERAVQADQPAQQVSAETTFDTDLALEALGEALERLAAKVWEQGAKKGRIGRTTVLKLKTDRFRILTRSLTLMQPPGSAAELAAIARQLCTARGPAGAHALPAGRGGDEQFPRRAGRGAAPGGAVRRRLLVVKIQ